MKKIIVDFGNSNTLVAIYDPEEEQVNSLEIPGISQSISYRLHEDSDLQTAHVIPSLVHFHEQGIWIGKQVLDRDLLEHTETWRWMKRRISLGVKKRRKTQRGLLNAFEAGKDFLVTLLTYLSDSFSFAEDEFVFTLPVESFEDFEDWLQEITDSLQIQRVRIMDEATSCILGYQGQISKDDRFLIFDFGCGTLDVSCVRVSMNEAKEPRALPLGRAGRDLGGLDIDTLIAEAFCQEHSLGGKERRLAEAELLPRSEKLKIQLSDPACDSAELNLMTTELGKARELVSIWDPSRFEGLLKKSDFLKEVRYTLDRALEEAALQSGVRRDAISKVIVTGGTSIVPQVRELLEESFPERVEYERPFDAVVRGAGRGWVVPLLQHDYAIESYNRETKDFEFKALFKAGTEYPTQAKGVKLWARGSYEGMTRIGIKIFEVSKMSRRSLEISLVDEEGVLQEDSQVRTDLKYICLNQENPTFILADPPVDLKRDVKRFLCTFQIDEKRRLCVTVEDKLAQNKLLDQHPIIRL